MMYHLEKKKMVYCFTGQNAVGKTSIIRSIGITVIMAQAGLFVPCEKFEYYPYKNIFQEYWEMIICLRVFLHLQLKCQS